MRVLAISLLAALLILSVSACSGSGVSPTAPTYPTGKPTGITAQSGSQSAELTWNAVGGAAGYFVYVSADGTIFNRVKGELIKTTQFLVLDLTNGKTYYFGVSAVGAGGWETSIAYPGGAPTAVPIVPETEGTPTNPLEGVPPAAPANLQGIAKDAACEMHWSANTEQDFSYYRIHREDESSSFSSFAMIRDQYGSTSFRNTDLINGQTYSYRITAVDLESLESHPSNIVTLTPMDFPPEALKNAAIYVNPGRILLEWSIPEEGDITKYSIQRVEGIDPGTGAEVIFRFVIDKPTTGTAEVPEEYASGLVKVYIDLAHNKIVLQDMAVVFGTTYTYRIAAIDETKQEGPPVQLVAPLPVF